MWRHGLLLRCKPSYLIFKDPAVSLINKTNYLNSKIYVKDIFTKNPSLFPVRSYSKSVSDVLPEISLEVKRTDPVDDDTAKQLGKSVLKEDATGSGDRHIDDVIVIKNNVGLINSEELCPNGVSLGLPKSILEGTDSEEGARQAKPSSPCNETDSEDKASQIGNQVNLKDLTTKNSGTDVVKLTRKSTRKGVRRPIDPALTQTDKSDLIDEASRMDTWSSKYEDKPVRRYENDQQQMLFDAIDMTNGLTSEQWDELHKKVLSAGDTVNEYNIHGSIMEKCLAHKRLGTGLSYLNYISASAQEPNVITIAKFCRLAALCPSEVDDNIQSIITSSYDSLRAKYPTFDASTADSVILGLCVTKRWKEGLEILDEIKLTCAPSKGSYSALIKASFDNDEPDIGWELLSKMLQDTKMPSDDVYGSWLQYCKRSAAGKKAAEQKLVEKMLHFLANNDVRLTEAAAIKFRLWFEYDAPAEADWNVEFTTVDSRGMCKSCHQMLKPITVTKEEFESLKAVFIEKTIVGSNIFLKSTPEELQDYQKFVQDTAPYDVVVDGLNVGYSAGSAKGSPNNYAKVLKSVVEYFVKRSQKVLVLGRRHMYNWPKHHMDFIYQNAEVFLAENLSQDDPYLLYATMYSGLGTRFISRDLMRGHAFLLKDAKLQSVFLRWQKQYQLQVTYTGEDGYVNFRRPQKFNTSPQCSRDGSWHVPYNLDTDSTRNQAFNAPRQWLCVSRFKERSYEDAFEDDSYKFANNRHESRVYGGNNQHSQQFRRSRSVGDSFDSGDENTSSQFGKRRFEDNTNTFRNNRYENRVYSGNNNKQSQFQKSRNESFDSSDDETASPSEFRKRNYVNKAFNDDSEPKFGRNKAAAQRYASGDEDEEKPSRFTKRNPRQPSDDYNDESSQFGKSRFVDQRSGGDERPKFRPASRMADGEDSGDEQTFRLKPKPSEERLKNEMLASESKQAFKANQTRGKPMRKEDD